MAEQTAQPKELGELRRITGIFWEPRPVFRNLAVHPRFWAPLLILTALSVVYIVAFSRVVGWDQMIRSQIESNPRLQQMSAQQRERAVEQGLKIGVPMGYAGAVLGPTVIYLAVAGIVLGVFNLLGGAGLLYPQAFSITCYSFLPTGLSTVLGMVVMFMKNPEDFDIRNPLPLNLGAFLDPNSTAKWLHSLASSVDLFSIWVMLLLAIGFSAAVKGMTFGKALGLVLLPWAVMVLVKCGLAAVAG